MVNAATIPITPSVIKTSASVNPFFNEILLFSRLQKASDSGE